MPHERFFTHQPLEDSVILTDNEFHHLCHVMRADVGECVELINGKNQLARATIAHIGKKQVELHIEKLESFPPANRAVILAQGMPRPNRLETILEKGTELGVTEFWLFPGILSEKETLSANQLKRMEQILISAMKQCGRLDLPLLLLKPPLLQWQTLPGTLFFGDLSPTAPWIWEHTTVLPPHSAVFLVIGPESGLHEKELCHLQTRLGGHGVRLHHNTLRTDTASITGLSLLQPIL